MNLNKNVVLIILSHQCIMTCTFKFGLDKNASDIFRKSGILLLINMFFILFNIVNEYLRYCVLHLKILRSFELMCLFDNCHSLHKMQNV